MWPFNGVTQGCDPKDPDPRVTQWTFQSPVCQVADRLHSPQEDKGHSGLGSPLIHLKGLGGQKEMGAGIPDPESLRA